MKLYRAASDATVGVGYSFAARKADAECYLDNPGFGGPTLYRAEIEIYSNDVVDLTDSSWETLAEILGLDADELCMDFGGHFASAITASNRIPKMLVEAGYTWAKFTDDYPEDCLTYSPLTASAAAEAQEKMEII